MPDRSISSERLPDFLVIGAQKCGTTTLFEDLGEHPGIRLADKESSVLLEPQPGTAASLQRMRRRYSVALPRRTADILLGEVATTYAMLPENPEVIANAVRLVPDAKIIYIVRDPVARVISHHHHDFALGLTGPDINASVHEHPSLLNNSRYATQIRPWLAAYGRDSVLVLRFEDYISDRQAGASTVFAFLGVSPLRLSNPDIVHNAADAKRVPVGTLGRIAESELYRNRVRPLLAGRFRRMISGHLLPKAPPRPAPPSTETVNFLIDQLWPEVDELARMLGTDPWWDRDDVLRRLLQPSDGPK